MVGVSKERQTTISPLVLSLQEYYTIEKENYLFSVTDVYIYIYIYIGTLKFYGKMLIFYTCNFCMENC